MIVGRVLRKTPKHGRLSEDSKLMAGRAFAVRGLSAQLGEHLLAALKRKESWAMAMFAQMRKRREVPTEVAPA